MTRSEQMLSFVKNNSITPGLTLTECWTIIKTQILQSKVKRRSGLCTEIEQSGFNSGFSWSMP